MQLKQFQGALSVGHELPQNPPAILEGSAAVVGPRGYVTARSHGLGKGCTGSQNAAEDNHANLFHKVPFRPRTQMHMYSKMLPPSMLPWVLLALPNERLRWLALRNCEKDEVESIVFLRPPKALVGKRNWV